MRALLRITEWVPRPCSSNSTKKVALEAFKPNMVIAGKKAKNRAGVEEVAEKTVKVLKACVPAAVPGIAFLSGGQSDEEATAHLDAMNRIGDLPWRLTFSYGRALQAAPQKAWSGKSENVAAAPRAFVHRAMMNSLAARGQWKQDSEKKAAEAALTLRTTSEPSKTPARRPLCPASRRRSARVRPAVSGAPITTARPPVGKRGTQCHVSCAVLPLLSPCRAALRGQANIRPPITIIVRWPPARVDTAGPLWRETCAAPRPASCNRKSAGRRRRRRRRDHRQGHA